MLMNFDVLKQDVEAMSSSLSFDEKIYNVVQAAFDKINDGTYNKWDIHDIKEEDDKYVVVLKVVTADELKAEVETTSEPQNECSCCQHIEECPQEICEQDMDEPVYERSIAYAGPWEDKKFEMDIAQVSAFFEVVQFCDYMVKRTQMVTPVGARSLQECQRFILEHLTEFNVDEVQEKEADPQKPLEVKIKDEFAEHLKKWQEESVQIFEKLISEMQKKPQIVAATMMPKDGFDPKGPSGLKI